jgi:C1A family cysteine protease
MFAFLAALSCSALILPHEERRFLSFMREHGLSYTGSEYHLRLGIFLTNLRLIRSFNSAGHSFTLGLTPLSCLTPSEYRFLLSSVGSSTIPSLRVSSSAAPDSWDWRAQGDVVPVEDQGQCAAGWALSITHAQASQWAITHGHLIVLSYQELVDCVTTTFGCNGGTPQAGFDYVIAHQDGHFMAAADYPSGNPGQCKYDPAKAVTTLIGYSQSATGDENALLSAVYENGPAIVAVDGSHNSFQLYASGIYNEPSCSTTNLDHLMIVVGYGVQGTTPYWILQNTWGTGWGENGCMRMRRNAGNMCGVATSPVIPRDAP